MTRPFLPSTRFAHRLLCVLMACVMVVAPLIVMAGEIHELEHVALGDSAVIETAQAAESAPLADADGGVLHDLADATQCCNHTAAMLPVSASFAVVTLPSVPLGWVGSTRDRGLTFLPFRPPIRA